MFRVEVPWIFYHLTAPGAGTQGGFNLVPFAYLDQNFGEIEDKFNLLLNSRVVTANTTLSLNDRVLICCAASPITITLPDTSGLAQNEVKTFYIINLSNYPVTLSNNIQILPQQRKKLLCSRAGFREGLGHFVRCGGYPYSFNSRPHSIPVAGSNAQIGLDWFVVNVDTVDGYHASQTPQANYIPVSLADGALDADWFSLLDRSFYDMIDLTNATEDYLLSRGETAVIYMNGQVSKPLRIATQNGTAYLMWIDPLNPGNSSGGGYPIRLWPNNLTYSTQFAYAEFYRYGGGMGSQYLTSENYFRIGWIYSQVTCLIVNWTVYKGIVGLYNSYGAVGLWPALYCFAGNWRNTTTSWMSLGTIAAGNYLYARIIVMRIL